LFPHIELGDWNNSTLIKGNPSAAISRLKAEGGGDIYVFGSANLSGTLINDNLFDEYRIAVAPVIAGSGRPLFQKDLTPRPLTLVSSQQLLTSGVVMTFRV
jgi:dihydrofolate reductase